ncbi:MAG: hypothetical protein ACJAUH_000002 [Saprospiraceae bacterium]|jgi:hypothetical protein
MFRRYSTILILLFVSTVSVFGQKTIKQLDYEKIIDNFNCEVAKYYIGANQDKDELDAYKDSITQFGCNFQHLMVFIKERQPKMKQNGYLATNINGLKKEYNLQASNGALYNKMVDIFKDSLLTQYDGKEDYQEFKKNYLRNLKEELRVHEIAKVGGDEGELEESRSFDSYLENFETGKFLFILGLIILIFFFIILGRWLWKYASTGKDDQTTFNLKPVESSYSPTPKVSIPKPVVPKSPVPEPRSVTPTIVDEPILPGAEILVEVPDEPEEDPNIFYMPYPKIDGSFYESSRHPYFEYGRSTFLFEIKVIEYNLATFEIISNEDVITDIFVNPEIIDPVCEVQGQTKNTESAIKSGVTKIITITPGMVQLSNAHWRLKQKAVIRFEFE